MNAIAIWEQAWSDYVNALEADDYSEIWAGEDFVFHVARNASNRKDAENRLRSIDPAFCRQLGI